MFVFRVISLIASRPTGCLPIIIIELPPFSSPSSSYMDLLLFSNFEGSKDDGGPLPVRFALIWLGKLMWRAAPVEFGV